MSNKPEVELVTIDRDDYDELTNDSLLLQCLNELGVDNWSGYDDAVELAEKRKHE